uniref:Uncharacterized protein n=1 Tax=Zea mays TaxID=4577 RepID=B8A0C2_MAIZE|nr:unknown [Zea mays]
MAADLAYHGRGPPTMEGRPLSGCRLRVWQFGRRSVARIRSPWVWTWRRLSRRVKWARLSRQGFASRTGEGEISSEGTMGLHDLGRSPTPTSGVDPRSWARVRE